MSITLHQQPTTPNAAFADLIWVASSTNQNQPQFQFVATIALTGSTDVVTLKQQPNPNGYGVFNMGSIASTLIDYDNLWKTQKFSTASLTGKTLVTTFGEEYGTSTSSSVSTYNTITGSKIYIIPAVVQPDAGYWNFPSSSYYDAVFASDGGTTYSYQNTLSNAPVTKSVRDGEYETISFINGNFENTPTASVYAQDIFEVQFKVYDSNNTLVQTQSFYNSVSNGGGPRITPTSELWVNVYNQQTDKTKLLTIGVGPQNIDDWTTALTSSWSYYTVKVLGQSDDALENESGVFAFRRYEKQTPECGYTGTRFAFINELGTWDYYTFPFADTINDSMTRSEYTQTFVDYSTTFGGVTYNASRRGAKVYNQDYQQDRVAESGFLTQEEADWLRQLVESPEVFIQSGTTFLPVVITNTSFNYKTNPRTQKLYRLTLTYKMANQKRSR
jgi:hypothetical protein